MTEHHVSPELADAYLDGLAAGMDLADTYRDEAAPRYQLSKPVRRFLLLVLIISLLGWAYGGLEMAGVVPSPGGNAGAPDVMLVPAIHAASHLNTR